MIMLFILSIFCHLWIIPFNYTCYVPSSVEISREKILIQNTDLHDLGPVPNQ